MKPTEHIGAQLERIAELCRRNRALSPDVVPDPPAFGPERFDARCRAIGIPEKIAGTLETLDVSRKAMRAALEFVGHSDTRPVLVLAGGVRTGKTTAACYAAAMAATPPRKVRWVRGDDSGFERGEVDVTGKPASAKFLHVWELATASQFDTPFWAALRKVHVLVIDDMGTEGNPGAGFLTIFGNLLCAREARGAKTIVTANMERDAFRAQYLTGPNERLLKRMREHAAAFVEVDKTGETVELVPPQEPITFPAYPEPGADG